MALGCAVVVVPSAAGSRSASVNGVEDGDDLDAAEDAAGQMAAGLRVRRALDLPLDEYDWVVASALLAAREVKLTAAGDFGTYSGSQTPDQSCVWSDLL
jgi:hypothetical protein